MPKKTKIKCKNCGKIFDSTEEIQIVKTWHMVSPIPDKEGNITINIMATWICPICGSRNRGKIASVKSGEQIRGRNPTQELINIVNQSEVITIQEISKILGVDKETVIKALKYLIKKKMINAVIEGDLVKKC